MSREEYNSRREFLKKMIAATAVAGVATYIDPATLFASPIPAKMPMRVMGKTGMKVGYLQSWSPGNC